VTERVSKAVLIGGALLTLPGLAFLSLTRPAYFTNSTYIGGLLLVEFLIMAVWLYRRVYFPLVLVAFLLAGVSLPVGGVWTVARWFFLCVGALVGIFIMLKERRTHFGLFHGLAVFAILAALVSAAVSRYPGFALLKAVSLLLLFVYAGTGVRLAVSGRENQFFTGLLSGCEVLVGILAACYFVGIAAMGNPNSLGAVMGVVAPILLWGTLLDDPVWVHRRRQVLFVISVYMAFHSHSRAGMAAAFLSCGLLCLALHRYKLLGIGIVIILIVVASSAIFDPDGYTSTVSSLTSSVVYKDKDPALGMLASRQSPWQTALDTIHNHFWFGTGFGTSDNGFDASQRLGMFSTVEGATSENGSSYLAILTWVGMLGALPFLLLLIVLLGKILSTVALMWKTGNPAHPAIPLAMVVFAGMLHAGFEDWMFAPGYYICVFFWSLAFVLVDFAPSQPLPHFDFARRSSPMQRGLGSVVPGR
jgi:O-antigen ligase